MRSVLSRLVLLGSLVVSVMACITDTHILDHDTSPIPAQDRLGLTDAEVQQILTFLNDCATTLHVLDDEVPLDADTAENLVEHRDGPDDTCGTGDDDPFDDLDEVDAVPQVGDASIEAILDYIVDGDHDHEDGGTWDDVELTSEQVEVILEIANEATRETLQDGVGLESDTTDNIISYRPHDDMDSLADTPQVGTRSIEKLRDYIGEWQAEHG